MSLRPLSLLAALALQGCVYAPLDLGLGELGRVYEHVVVDGNEDEKVLLLRIDGEISSHEDAGLLFGSDPATTATIRQQLDLARRDDAIKGVLLRIDSPGGGVTASDLIHHELTRFRQETGKPIVAWFGDTAASGGYYVAQAADLVVAAPTCVTGSIGVIATFPEVSGLGEKIGVDVETIKSGKNKDLGSPFRPMQPEERQLLQDLIDRMYARFVDVVAAGRARVGLTREQLLPLADGRVYTAPEAEAAKLIDAQGYLEDALQRLAGLTGSADPQVVVYERRTFGGPAPTIYGTAARVAQVDLSAAGNPVASIARTVLPRPGPVLRYQWMPAAR